VARTIGVALAVGGSLVILVAISRLPDPALIPLFGVAVLLGATLIWSDYGFTAGFRNFVVRGDGRALGAAFLVPALAGLVVVPLAGSDGNYARFVAPIGTPLVLGAALFGAGMQIANGCGSGSLVAAGQGSRRMWVVLPFFCLGGVLGSLLLPVLLRLPDLGVIDLPAILGTWGGLLANEAILLVGALILLRGSRPQPQHWRAAGLIGLLAGLLFLVSGEPWGITMGLTVLGAKMLFAMGIDVSGYEFWTEDWARQALHGPMLAMHGVLSDIGLILGGLMAAASLGRLRHAAPLGWRGTAGAIAGGLLMGVGARLSFGCNVGAFVGGASSGSLHGLVWLMAALPGCWLGIRLRPLFGLDL